MGIDVQELKMLRFLMRCSHAEEIIRDQRQQLGTQNSAASPNISMRSVSIINGISLDFPYGIYSQPPRVISYRGRL